jgi:biotin operon repressor
MVFWFFGKKNNEIEKVRENLKHSFSNIKNDIQSIHGVLKHFKQKHEDHDEKHSLHSERFDKIEDEIAKIYEILKEFDRHSHERSIVHERVQSFNRSNQSFMNVQSLEDLKERLTTSQKRVIQLLNTTDIPLEYEDIAHELKLSIITIRRHINDIKKIGFQVKEKVDINKKRKVFYLDLGVKKAIKAIKVRK